MQTEEGKVEHEMCTRLRIGGRWYGRGEKIELTKDEATVYESRGISKPTVREPSAEKQQSSIPPSQVGAITKANDEEVKTDAEVKQLENTGHGKSRSKGR